MGRGCGERAQAGCRRQEAQLGAISAPTKAGLVGGEGSGPEIFHFLGHHNSLFAAHPPSFPPPLPRHDKLLASMLGWRPLLFLSLPIRSYHQAESSSSAFHSGDRSAFHDPTGKGRGQGLCSPGPSCAVQHLCSVNAPACFLVCSDLVHNPGLCKDTPYRSCQ